MFQLKNKAHNLGVLKLALKNRAIVPNYYYLNFKQFKINKKKQIKKIFHQLKTKKLILRSSAFNEDKENLSNAGKYNSLTLNKKVSKVNLIKLINRFLKQFSNKSDKIIIQELVDNVDISGVIFTRDSNLNSPYFVVEYDNSGKTNLITSGVKNDSIKTEIIYKNFKYNGKFKKLISCCKILENKISHDRLDLEFAIKNNKLILFQVRKLPLNNFIRNINDDTFDNTLTNITKKIDKIFSKNETLSGDRTILSNMSDWNPAEMLGDKPNTLAITLYKELISDKIWSTQRKNYGYKDVSPNPLIYSFAGSPYVDLRTDLNSFLPKNLNNKLSAKIVNNLIKRLSKNISIHDKIEFDLIETCSSFNSHKRVNFLNKKEKNIYLKELKNLTREIIKKNIHIVEEEKILDLKKSLDTMENMRIHPIQKIFYLVDVLKKKGTLPFAGLARCAFISQRILRDLKENSLIDDTEIQRFYGSLDTVTSTLSLDLNKLFSKKTTKKKFLSIYGHLRPSTYDINSKNYSEGFNDYFKVRKLNKRNKIKKFHKFNNHIIINKKIDKLLGISLNKFLEFAKKSIKLREFSKFQFTRGVDLIFQSIIFLGNEVKIKRSQLAYLDIKNIINYFNKLDVVKLKSSLIKEIKINKFEHDQLQLINLPDVIVRSSDVKNFTKEYGKPNYITDKIVLENCANLKNKNLSHIKNKIVLIKNADPGYDFIFNFNIKGLITQYGGANSHMAIRCLELGIPAAIGVGEKLFEKITKYKRKIQLNSKNKSINFV